MIPFMPESHIYHIRHDREEKAKKCMLRIYGTAPDYDVVSIVQKMLQLLANRARIMSIWSSRNK